MLSPQIIFVFQFFNSVLLPDFDIELIQPDKYIFSIYVAAAYSGIRYNTVQPPLKSGTENSEHIIHENKKESADTTLPTLYITLNKNCPI
jgi:hypothetical protein